MLYFDKLSLRRGKKLLFDRAAFTVNRGDKVGITGANGCGKSSLFFLIRGEIEEDAGNFRAEAGITLAHVAQETPAVATSAIGCTKSLPQSMAMPPDRGLHVSCTVLASPPDRRVCRWRTSRVAGACG